MKRKDADLKNLYQEYVHLPELAKANLQPSFKKSFVGRFTKEKRDRLNSIVKLQVPHQEKSHLFNVSIMGTVVILPKTPNPISSGLRPTLSDNKPNIGCNSIKTNKVKDEMSVALLMLNPAVFTRNFCM